MSAQGSAIGRGTHRGRLREAGFRAALLACLGAALAVLAALFVDVLRDGLGQVDLQFLTSFGSFDPKRAGLESALTGSLWLLAVCAAFIVPVGVATAVYLEEYADPGRWWNRLVEVNIQNLAAVPSIVYGILGLAFLVRGPLSLGRVVLAGALTLGLLVLPVVIIAAREAIRAVPPSIREGSMALGATQWQTIWKQVLPASIPGIATGVILALSRAVGETMIVALAAGTQARMVAGPTEFGQTMTGFIAQTATGESTPGTLSYNTFFAVGLLLFLITFLINMVSIRLVRRFREAY